VELRLWASFGLIHRGEAERGAAMPREVVASSEGWTTLLSLLGDLDAPALAEARRLVGAQPAGEGGAGVGPT